MFSLFTCCLFRLVVVTDCLLSLYLQPPPYRKRHVHLLFIQFTLVGRQCSSAVPRKRSILQVFRSFRTGTTDTDAAPACVPNIVANFWNRLYPKTDNVERSRGPYPLFISYCYQDEGAQWRRGSREPQIIFGHVSFSLFSVSKCAYNLKGEHTSNQYTNTYEVLPHSWPSLPFPQG